MTSKQNTQKRSWFVTIVASVFAVLSIFVAIIGFKPSLLEILISFAFVVFAFLCTVVAINGKKKTLREIIDTIWYLPS